MLAVCEKCEFDPDKTVLLRTCQSEESLDLTKSLNDYGIRELYAIDTKVVPTSSPSDPVSTHEGGEEEQKTPVKEKNHKEKGNKGFITVFKKSKKTPELAVSVSAPFSPELNSQHVVKVNGHSTLPTATADMTKKRRAPQPPLTMSQSISCELHTRDFTNLPENNTAGKQSLLSRISSTESSLKRTKRRAPPPPCDGPYPSDSDNKEEFEEDDSSSDKYRAGIAGHCPLIAEVMTELAESLQAQQQRMLFSANSSSSQHHPTEDHCQSLVSKSSTPEAEFKAPPGCRLLRNSTDREGMTTFTVVPQRCQPSRKCFEVALMLQAPDTAKAEEELCPGAPEDQEIHGTEPFRNGDNGFDKSEHLSGILHLQHLEKENQEWADSETKIVEQKDEKPSIHTRNIELESLKSFKRGLNNLELLGSTINNPEIRNADFKSSEVRESLTINFEPADNHERSPIVSDIKGSLVEREEIPEYALVETRKERDWIEEYKERRRKFLGGDDDDGRRKLDSWERTENKFRNTPMETRTQGIHDIFPLPPPPIYWYEDDSDGENEEKNEERDKENMSEHDDDTATNNLSCDTDLEQWPNLDLIPAPNPHIGSNFDSHSNCSDCNVRFDLEPKYAPFPHLSKPKAHSTQTNPKPNTSDAKWKFNSTLEPYRTSYLTPQPNPGCTPKSHSNFDPCPPEKVSLFTLAVFQKAKHFRPRLDSMRFKKRESPVHTHTIVDDQSECGRVALA
ncbi:uncharacterized protein LOC127446471 isoform X2 [Myxocyprinus asiaticus]|nr:uncharacterized protein LOC127446471 isoform X2 [Myxocyprinus asiaticus]